MKPVIGITSNYSYDDKSPFQSGIGVPCQEWQMCPDDYISAIIRAGGLPVMIPVMEDLDATREILDRVDGVLVTGGNDIGPEMYGEEPVPELQASIPMRDKQDCFVTRYIIEQSNKPYWGICRGTQVMNVALGGSLYQHLPHIGVQGSTQDFEIPRSEVSHSVRITPGSLLYRILGKEEIRVNSFHHQSVKQLAAGLKIVGEDPRTHVVEALELEQNSGGRFVLATQWHPEMMVSDKASPYFSEQQTLFNAFVDSCR